jgi:hypothetical protein
MLIWVKITTWVLTFQLRHWRRNDTQNTPLYQDIKLKQLLDNTELLRTMVIIQRMSINIDKQNNRSTINFTFLSH